MISSFSGQYRFLSNFWPAPIVLFEITWPTNEHAFQAMKAVTRKDAMRILQCRTPAEAKKLGRHVQRMDDWDNVRLMAMQTVTAAKYSQHPDLLEKLLATGDQELVEGNHWNDRFWGVCNGEGENHLGKILMNYRGFKRDANIGNPFATLKLKAPKG